MAGIVAGMGESLMSSPFEFFKLRAQVNAASRVTSSTSVAEKVAVSPVIKRLLPGYTPDKKALSHSIGLLSILTNKYPNMMGALQEYPWMMTGSGKPPSVYNVQRPFDIISLEGWSTLWRGLRSGVARDSVFGGMFFSSWQFLHQSMLYWKAAGMNSPPRFQKSSFKHVITKIFDFRISTFTYLTGFSSCC